MSMRLLHRGQKGLTIIELLIAIAITSLITGGIATLVYQIYTGSARSSNHIVAVRQVQEAGFWVSQYAYTSQNTTITGTSGFPLILSWVSFESSEKHQIVFSLNSSGLRGSYYVNNVSNSSLTNKIPVFGFINATQTNCQVSGGSDFSLPASGNKFVITGGATNDTGRITGGNISVTKTGSATYNTTSGAWTTTNTTTDTIIVTATGAAKGSWTSENKAATAAITVGGQAATLSSAGGLVFNVTATVGTGRNVANETRIYKVIPKSTS